MIKLYSFRNVLIFSVAIRVSLILYSEWHDAHSVVKYTDVDYRVFSDAAQFLLHPGPDNQNRAQGPLVEFFGLNIGDPYTRETYRYTPLLALLLTPNEWLHPSFGKYLFAACDIINGVLIYVLLSSVVLPDTRKRHGTHEPPEKDEKPTTTTLESQATLCAAFHLLNPLVFSISTRGSSESVLSLLVLLTLYAALAGRWNCAAVLLGVSTHWKIYPVIYGVSCLGVIQGKDIGWKRYVNASTVKFGIVSASTFVMTGVVCWSIWGYPFLYESYLYHLHRLDHRHNFSPYFYLIYLTYPSATASSTLSVSTWSRILRSPLTSFVPQMGLSLGTGLLFGRRRENLAFAWFVQTFVFVVFNKVCTSQYFLWYLLLLPLLLPRLYIAPKWAVAYLGVWVGTQALWLAEAYKLEFVGEDVFYGLWVRGLIYVVGNCWVLGGIMDGYLKVPK